MITHAKDVPYDRSILDRISEPEILQWLAARINKASEDTGIKFRVLSANIIKRDTPAPISCYGNFTMNAVDKCGTGAEVKDVIESVRAALMANPQYRAAEKRREAEALLKEAERLEALR